MEPVQEAWDYCTIVFRTYLTMGSGEYGGLNYGLLWFEAEAKGPNGRYAAGKSTEVPFGRMADGAPDKRNAAHQSVHRDLVSTLRRNGWEPISGGGSSWWEQRFRRVPEKAFSSLNQKIRRFFALVKK